MVPTPQGAGATPPLPGVATSVQLVAKAAFKFRNLTPKNVRAGGAMEGTSFNLLVFQVRTFNPDEGVIPSR